jgi:hypothetical protein
MLAHVPILNATGETIRGILRQSFPGEHCDLAVRRPAAAHDLRWARRFYPRLRSVAGHCIVPFGDLNEIGLTPRFFTFLRDPAERCVAQYLTCFLNSCSREPFQRWLIRHANHQTRMLSNANEAEQAIEIIESRIGFVGLIERFKESLVLLRHWSGEPKMDLRYRSRRVASDARLKQEILGDPRMVALIHECHEQDSTLYRYVRDVVYPRQIARFGPGLTQACEKLEQSLPGPMVLSLPQLLASAKRNLVYKPLTRIVRKAA